MQDGRWVSWFGDLGQEATLQLLAQVAFVDPVWKARLVKEINDLTAELLGDEPSVLEKLLVRRVINGWIAVHSLELEFAACEKTSLGLWDHLEKSMTRAQKRYTEAMHELARVRRLQAPKILRQATGVESGDTRSTT